MIFIQQEFINKMLAAGQANRNYYTIKTKAWRAAIAELVEIGWSKAEAERAMEDANDVLALEHIHRNTANYMKSITQAETR